jgi:hypothetical protein
MPKLYEYLGIVIFFYSNEHEPVHVHGRYQGRESKIEIVLKEGRVSELLTLEVRGKKPLPSSQLKDFEHLVQVLADEIVHSWVNYFVYHKKIVSKKIQGKI